MRIDRRVLANFDWGTLGLTLATTTLSIIVLSSATYDRTAGLATIPMKQLLWLGVGGLGMLAVLSVDYQVLCRYACVLYGLLLLSLIAVLVFGRVINGSQRWLVIGPWNWQPSELLKPVLILMLARYFAEDRQQSTSPLTLRGLCIPLLLVGVPFVLIIRQPDLSTAMTMLVTLGAMLVMVGLERRTLLLSIMAGAGALPVGWHLLAEYQRTRLLTLLYPESDLLGAGYHSWQSKIAIGSGGLWGKGLFGGTQSHLHFLPEKHTDFIFAVLGEEMGFLGSLMLLCLFGGLLVHGFSVAYHARDRLGALVAMGVITMLTTHVFLNIGMTTGMLPIIGLPLPLMSYGGSSLVTTLLSLGLLMNVRMRRFKF